MQPYRVAYPNLSFFYPVFFKAVPNDDKIVVGQLDGNIYWISTDENTTQKNTLVDLSDEVGFVWDGGLLGLAIHPNYGNGDNYFYIFYTTEDSNSNDYPNSYLGQNCDLEQYYGNFLILERFEVDPSTLALIPGSRTTLIKDRMYGTTHRGGGMEFGDDGFLYLTTGDQTAWKKSQDFINNLDGGVLRLDVDKDPTKSHPATRTKPQDVGEADEITGVEYWIPNDNPFVNAAGTNFEEYWSVGLRNPFRMTKDSETGKFYIGDVGLNKHEEVNILEKGKNYGWPVFEGYADGPNGCVSELLNDMPHEGPLLAFPRANVNSLIGGYVYRGSEMPELYGKYICADYGSGEELWTVDIDDGSFEQLAIFSPANVISFGEDHNKELFILKAGANTTLYKMISPTAIDYDSFPQTLTETGAFTNLNTLEVDDGIIPYELIESFWSDGALKKRWLAIPNDGAYDTEGERIDYSENGDWEFPVGSVIIKHFELPVDDNNPSVTKKIETRFSIVGDDGKFYFLTYNWNDQETEAYLQEVALDETVDIATTSGGTRTQTWHFPSNSECTSCHNSANKGALGLRSRFLNKDLTYDATGLTGNQLVTLSHLGIIDESITDTDTPNILTSKSIYDASASLDEKARSYLDLNCAYCHRTDNNNRAQFDLRLFNSLEATEILNADILSPLNVSPDEEIIFPGNASKSILYHRIASVDPVVMMPPLSKSVVDTEALNMIASWINQLETPESTFNSPDESTNLALLKSASLSGSVTNGRGKFEDILYDPRVSNYYDPTEFNEYGLDYTTNLGTPTIDDAFQWQVNWPNPKNINYITFGGSYADAPQPNTMWRISYRLDNVWTILDDGQGGWINNGIFAWDGTTQEPIQADAIKVELYSDGVNEVTGVHLRGRGGKSTGLIDDSLTTPKATLIQFLPYTNSCGIAIPNEAMVYCNDTWSNNVGPSLTSDNKNVLIADGTWTINEDEQFNINDLVIANGAALIIKEGASLKINGDLTNNGSLILESISTKYSSLIVDGASVGEMSYKRHVNGFASAAKNDLISSPFVGEIFGDFATANPNIYENPLNTDQKLFGIFDEPLGDFLTYVTSDIDDAAAPLTNGVGFRAARDASEDAIDGSTFTFSGTLRSGAFNVPITESSSAYAGWNLIGNPYPSYMDFDTFFALNEDQLDISNHKAIYGYDGNASDGWIIYNNLTPNRLIAPGQGFFVKVKSGGGSITFSPNMRSTGNSDDFIQGRNSTSHLGYINLMMTSEVNTYTTEVYFNANASLGLDPGYDAASFDQSNSNFSLHTHLVENSVGSNFAVQALSGDALNNVRIPLAINASQGDNITISINESDVSSAINVYLEDTSNNTFTRLNEDSYNFIANAEITGVGRFYLLFENQSLTTPEESIKDLNIFTDYVNKSIVIDGPVLQNTNAILYDLRGREMTKSQLSTTKVKHVIKTEHLSSGIYILELNNKLGSKRIEKLIIK